MLNKRQARWAVTGLTGGSSDCGAGSLGELQNAVWASVAPERWGAKKALQAGGVV